MTEYAWFDAGDGRQVYRKIPEPNRSRSDIACPMLIRDDMPPTEHVDGRFYESKSAFRKVTRQRGFIEVGDDKSRFDMAPRQQSNRKAVKDAVERARARVSRGEGAHP